jgi:hypothetical protein
MEAKTTTYRTNPAQDAFDRTGAARVAQRARRIAQKDEPVSSPPLLPS